MTEEKPRFGQQTRTLEEQIEFIAFTDEAALKLADEGIKEARLEAKYPFYSKLDIVAQKACNDWHQAYNVLSIEFAKSVAKEKVYNQFDVEELWRDYMLKKAKWDFIADKVDNYRPTDEEEWKCEDWCQDEVKKWL